MSADRPADGARWQTTAAASFTHGQDSHAALHRPDGVWLIVADGATGRPDGLLAARTAVEAAVGSLVSTPVEVTGATRALIQADRALRAAADIGTMSDLAVTTLTVVGITAERTVTAWRGDSMAWFCSPVAGKAVRLTHTVTPHLGPSMDGIAGSMETAGLAGGDLLLLATDGLWPSTVENQPFQIADLWTPDEMIRVARAAGSTDDVTVLTAGYAAVSLDSTV